MDADQAAIYQIRLKGQLAQRWSDWFEGLALTILDDGDTLLTGPLPDQAALHGVLKKVRDLGMPLLAVNCLGSDPGAGGYVETDGPASAAEGMRVSNVE
ncbi:MAG TPA: hypothetical protein VGF67_33655 [Ktedonobacteraceae bacterium]|jgi:hypothetical protein